MSTIDALDIITDASQLLYDATNVRWDTTELLRWLNAAQRQVVKVKPESNAVNATATTVTGVKQSLPADGILLINVERNNGAVDGSTPGRVITVIDKSVLDIEDPDWHSAIPVSEIQHYSYDPNNPKVIYIYPSIEAGKFFDFVYSGIPVSIANIVAGTKITIDDIYADNLLDWVLYRAFSKDSKNQDLPKSAMYRKSFMESFGIKEQVEKRTEPRAMKKASQ